MWTPQQKIQCVLWLMEFKSRMHSDVFEQKGISLLACLIDFRVSGLLQNESRPRLTVYSSRKLKDTCQFEIPKFPSPLKFFPIGGKILMSEDRHSFLFEHVAVYAWLN
ncbi:hypothetical protein TNCV_2970131 [Trichonephila clavipes]|nr:hypothetical protein TNCV_2970131 [Trichonephila clavipes]